MPCPELVPGGGVPDVVIADGHVPADLPGSGNPGKQVQVLPGQVLLDVKGTARFLVRDGREVFIDRYPAASDDAIRLFLLGSVFGTLMHQRGMLVLHGSTVQVEGGCICFLGHSGVGKSTLALEISSRGYPSLGDDVCAISIGEDGLPYAAPSYPQAKLWSHSLGYFGLNATKLRRVRPALDKHAVPLTGSTSDRPLPVKALYILSLANPHVQELEVRPLVGPVKMRALRDHTYRGPFLLALGLASHHFAQIARLVARVPVTRLVRPRFEVPVKPIADVVEVHLASQGIKRRSS
jgi:hypothetical protein